MGTFVYVVATTGFGQLISSFTRTQVAAVFATAILSIVPAVNFSGLFAPVSSLSGGAKIIGLSFPSAWYQPITVGVFAKALGMARPLAQRRRDLGHCARLPRHLAGSASQAGGVTCPRRARQQRAAFAEAKPLTFVDHIANIFRLVIKELRSIRADPTMLILVAYAFSISVNTVATGAVTEATNLSVGIVDEDGSDLSRQIAEGPRSADVPAAGADQGDRHRLGRWTRASFCSSSKSRPISRPTFAPSARPAIQINVDATAVAQAGNGASYLKNVIANEVQNFISGREGWNGGPINLVIRAKFNPNLKTAWFSAMTQVINQITLLTVILTGAALIREREQGTVEHLLVMPVVPTEIMLAKIIANGLVILVAAMLSLQFVVHWWIGVADRRITACCSSFGAALYALVVAALGILLGTLSTTMGQFGLLAMPVLMVTQLLSGSSTPMESMPVWLQYVMQTISPTPHFVAFAQAVLFRGADHYARLAAACGHVRDRRRLFRRRPEPFPPRHFWQLSVSPPNALRTFIHAINVRVGSNSADSTLPVECPFSLAIVWILPFRFRPKFDYSRQWRFWLVQLVRSRAQIGSSEG